MRFPVLAAAIAAFAWQALPPALDASASPPAAPRAMSQASPPAPAGASDLDAFMSKVLERRSEVWRTLHDYILSERERFELTGPGDQRLYGMKREFAWFVREGYLIRSPLRVNGVEPGERERQDYENRWLRDEQSREKRAAEKALKQERDHDSAVAAPAGDPAEATDSSALVRQGLEPRFISEAYFMQFKFDPGNYYLAGRETLDGRRVLRIEYYPKQLYTSDEERQRRETRTEAKSEIRADQAGPAPAEPGARASAKPDPAADDRARRKEAFEREVEHKFNKVALITLWIDPNEHQIVKYTFDNTEFNFLPGRSLVRVGDISLSMTMGQYFQEVWLPREIVGHASLTLANGSYDAHYAREFFDYRQGEVKARIRSYSPVEK